ncbi:2,3-diaminopropionate biosynthesis protein SbnB [Actinokineospora sp.]|uniref:2,3-diaminopropionate biosynthesis protein SbnB n=1 Tax=Actinokineospora sp. TaxID=1872133 RepID=UPI004037A354
MLILRHSDVTTVLDSSDEAVCQAIRTAYVAHCRRETSVPHSVFLRFPNDTSNRIIALPAYVGGDRPVASLKWIASFPGNIQHDQERASAAILLNSVVDGTPVALLEGSVISARRTAASAAIAAAVLTADAPDYVRAGVSLIGCGVINHEVLRFLRGQLPRLRRVTLFDLDADRARAFAGRVADQWPDLEVDIGGGIDAALAAHRIVSIATTAATPHTSTEPCQPGTVLLHLSLRDLTPESILAATNVVDDADHVCRAGTSLDLAQQAVGHRGFITAEIGDLLTERASLPYDPTATVVFSPFGLGALDATLAAHVYDTATELDFGVRVADFLSDRSSRREGNVGR